MRTLAEQKRGQQFIRTHDETLFVFAVCVCNPRQDPLDSKEWCLNCVCGRQPYRPSHLATFTVGRGRTHTCRGDQRTGIENKWFALMGRAVTLKVETHGDRHTAFKQHPQVALLLRISYQRSNHSSS